ncbi:hypothetical protein ASE61_01150 [Bosea sp. Root670]|uniref:hypothetical protein n=1 Tax=Bosea sp. Root670 TaxID=1736583 RepID=UPI000715B7B6|nr:hypothetical protein [Bosea sp. Root670]KRE08246.1 hypothetical protein ASE61_01150 [Bosea sp. Root670]
MKRGHGLSDGGIATMKSLRQTLVASLGLVALAWASAQPAVAQYYGGQGNGYERRGQERNGYERNGYQRRDSWRDDDRGSRFGRDDGRGGYGRRTQNPMAGMSLEEQKRAVKNEREAQKKAFKRGQIFQ